jgi:hypothetical protein
MQRKVHYRATWKLSSALKYKKVWDRGKETREGIRKGVESLSHEERQTGEVAVR